MKRTTILPGHYEKFVQKAKRNTKMIRIPSHQELEDSGFDITDLYFLILPNGLQVNPETVNPDTDLFDDAIKPLFLKDWKVYKEPAVVKTVAQETKNMLQEATYQVCDTCGENKPMEAFKKRPGRGVLRKSTCIECEANAKEPIPQFKDDATPAPKLDQLPNPEAVEGTVVVPARPAVTVTLDYLKRLATQAFERGREYERNNVETVEPSLDELLGIGA